MSDEFKGSAQKITENDFSNAADMLGCDVAAVKAVVEVESAGGGFFKDKRPKILFESRWFGKFTNGKYHSSHPHLSTRKWVRNYKGGTKEYSRLEEAMKLDREAALKSTSWGMFQVMGFNCKVAGYADVEEFVIAQVDSEGAQLKAFVNFVKGNKLDDELRDLRWADFARGYNGPGYKRNRYDTKLANAYEKHAGGVIKPSTKDVQTALNKFGFSLTADGVTGPKTRNAIRQFQRDHGLAADGVAGPKTLEALGLGESGDSIILAKLIVED